MNGYNETLLLPEAGHQLFWTTNDVLGDYAIWETPRLPSATVNVVRDGVLVEGIALRVLDWDAYVRLNMRGDATNEEYEAEVFTLVLTLEDFMAATFM